MKIKDITEAIYPSATVNNHRRNQLIAYLNKNQLKKPITPDEIAWALVDLGNRQHRVDQSYEKKLERLLAQARRQNN